MAIYALYFYAIVKLVPIVLTLPGIAGLILTLGRSGGRQHRDLRARQGGGARRPKHRRRRSRRATRRASRRSSTRTSSRSWSRSSCSCSRPRACAASRSRSGVGVMLSLFTAVVATQAILYSLRGTRLLRSRVRARRARLQADPVRLHRQVEVVLLDVGRDPARLRDRDVGAGPELRHRLRGRHPDHRRAEQAGDRRPGARHPGQPGPERRRGPDDHEQGARATTSSRSARTSSARTVSTASTNALRDRFGLADNPSTQQIGASFGQSVAEERDLRDHRLADRHLDLHHAALPVEVRGAGDDRPRTRPADHRRRLRTRSAGR